MQPDRGSSRWVGCYLPFHRPCISAEFRYCRSVDTRRFERLGGLFFLLFFVSFQSVEAAFDLSSCPVPSFLDLGMQPLDECSLFARNMDVEVIIPRVSELDESTLETALQWVQSGKSTHVAVLFYANWCQFSKRFRPIFHVLSSKFPSISHVAVEESAIRPSVLSQYGVHGFPYIVLYNRTSRMRYRGSRMLENLVAFYNNITGLQPVNTDSYMDEEIHSFVNLMEIDANREREGFPYTWDKSLDKWLKEDTYLFLAAIFLMCRLLYFFLQKAASSMKGCWNIRHVHEVIERVPAVPIAEEQHGRSCIRPVANVECAGAVENVNVGVRTLQEAAPSATGALSVPGWRHTTCQMASASSSLAPTAVTECSSSRAGVPDDMREVGGMIHRMELKRSGRPGVSDDLREVSRRLEKMDLKRSHKTKWRT